MPIEVRVNGESRLRLRQTLLFVRPCEFSDRLPLTKSSDRLGNPGIENRRSGDIVKEKVGTIAFLRNGPGMKDRQVPQQPRTPLARQAYWRANLRLIAILLSIWAVVSLVFGVLLVETLNKLKIGSLPLGFWFAQQGSIYVFVALIFVYAWRMDALDRRFGVDE